MLFSTIKIEEEYGYPLLAPKQWYSLYSVSILTLQRYNHYYGDKADDRRHIIEFFVHCNKFVDVPTLEVDESYSV